MRIAILGTVGAGKTTLIEKLKDQLPSTYQVFKEPLMDNPYFEDSYSPDLKVAKTAAYKMELTMLTARMKQFHESLVLENVLYDRSILDCLVFAHCNFLTTRLSETDWQVYLEYFEKVILPYIFISHQHQGYDLIIYLKVSPEKSLQRIQKRAITRELNVDADFWKLLVDLYNHWVEKFNQLTKIIVIDGNIDNPDVYTQEILKIIGEKQK